jgi:signal transduction histidine kinase
MMSLEREAIEHDLDAVLKLKSELVTVKENAEQLSLVKNEFLSRMSHEMRTPMNTIIGMTMLAQNTDDPENRNDCLEKVGCASRDLLRLIDNVLDLSDIEEGKFSLVKTEFAFAAMLKRVFIKAQSCFDVKNQAFITAIDPSVPEFMICDEERLAQVITSLLVNAGKFTGDHGLIQFKAFVKDVENDLLTMQIEIADNGIGISEKQEEKLFVAFEQLDGGTKRKYGGAGLGLHLSKKIIEMMGGEIWMESEPDIGSKFTFTFKTKIKAPHIETKSHVFFHNKTELLAEDVEATRKIRTFEEGRTERIPLIAITANVLS